MRIADLRQEYRDQAEQKRDCERNFIKFSWECFKPFPILIVIKIYNSKDIYKKKIN